MKIRKFVLCVLILFTTVFISCTGEDGNAYQKYYWAGAPLYFYDTNPYTPDIVYNDEYFYTGPGSYYMEYDAWDGSGWYMYYTIYIEEGKFLEDGDDIWYEIFLSSSGPDIYGYSYARSLEGKKAQNEETGKKSIVMGKEAKELRKGPIIGKEEREYKNGKITIEYGRLYY